jgi:shikimate kinase
MNVVLSGMRGTGKSSIGRVLADLLGFRFVDTDAGIEGLAGCPIADIVAHHGWGYFRALEHRVVEQVAAADKQVVAAGGGTLIDEENATLLKAQGVIVLLVCDTAVLQRRIVAGSNRPSLTGQASAVEELEQVWQARQTRYRIVADLVYDVSAESDDSERDIQRKAAAIRDLLQRLAGRS